MSKTRRKEIIYLQKMKLLTGHWSINREKNVIESKREKNIIAICK